MTGLHPGDCVKGSRVRDVLCSSLLFSDSRPGKLEVKRDSFLAPKPEGSLGTKVSLRQRKSVHNTFRLAQGDAALTSVTVGVLKKKKKKMPLRPFGERRRVGPRTCGFYLTEST